MTIGGGIGSRHWTCEQGAEAAEARKWFPRVYSCKRYWHAKTQSEYWTEGLGHIVANCFKSGLLDIPSYHSISIMNRESTFADGAGTTGDDVYRRWRNYPAIYGDFVVVLRNAQAETLRPHRSIAINLERR